VGAIKNKTKKSTVDKQTIERERENEGESAGLAVWRFALLLGRHLLLKLHLHLALQGQLELFDIQKMKNFLISTSSSSSST
jgi:hypothetical protein